MANTQRSELCAKAGRLGEMLVQIGDLHILTRFISGERYKALIYSLLKDGRHTLLTKGEQKVFVEPIRRMRRRELARIQWSHVWLRGIIAVIGIVATFGYVFYVSPSAHASSFTIDQNFTSRAEQYVQVTEPGYINGNDCTHWISWFLNTAYRMPNTMMRIWTDNLVNELIQDGDAQVITGDGQYNAGAFIPYTQAGGIIASLDANLVENGGNAEYLIAYKWKPPKTHALADHLTVYVGNEKVVSHGITFYVGGPGGYNRTPRLWNAFADMGTVAVIELTNIVHTEHTPVAIQNRDGHMEVFMVGSDGQLYHNWEDMHGNWSGWQSLGGNWPGQPAVAVDFYGRLNIFMVGDFGPTGSTLFHAWQQNPNDSSSYTGWQPMASNPAGNWPIGTPAVIQNLYGGLEVYMRGLDSNLYHAHEVVPGAGNNNYTTWQPMGGYWNTDPVVARNQDSSMQVFMVGESTQLYYDQENIYGAWSGWQSLGGSWPSEPAVTLNNQGELEVFISGNQGPNGATLFHSWQSSPGSSSWVMNQYGGWNGLPGTWSAGIPTVAKNSNDTMDVFLPCFGNLPPLCHVYEAPNGGWSGQQAISGHWPGDASSTINLPGGIELFMLGTTGQIYHAWQNNAGDSSSYSHWYTLGAP